MDKTSNSSKKVIIKLSKREDAAKIQSSKKKSKGWNSPLLKSEANFTLMVAHVNTTNYFSKNIKACSQTNLFTPFGLPMGYQCSVKSCGEWLSAFISLI